LKRKEHKMFYKRSCLASLIIISLLCVLSGVGMCTTPVLENPSFETGDYSGWTAVYDTDLYMLDKNTNQWWCPTAISDISEDGKGTDGFWFIMWYDDGLYQVADETIGQGEVYAVSVDACSAWNAVGVKVDLGYQDGSNYVTELTETFVPNNASENGVWERFELEYIPSGNAVGKNFYIKIGNDDFGEWLAIDNVQLEMYMAYASNVYPPNKSTDIPIDGDLEWTLEEGFTCDVYFGTQGDPNVGLNPKVIDDEYETTYDPGILEYDTTYYWRVDPIDPNNGSPFTYTGPTWWFTTMSTMPSIVGGPYSETGDVVTLEVETAGIPPTGYDWYKVGEPDTLYATTTEPSLTIDVGSDIGLEGYYYCIVTNDYGSSEPSASARVMKPRLVGWWKLDGDLTDSVALAEPGAPTHDGSGDPNTFTTGVDGSCAQFIGDGRLVTITESSDYFNFYPQGLTVSTWVNCSLDGTWDGVVGKQANGDDWWRSGWVTGVNGDSSDILGASVVVRRVWGNMFGNPDDGDIHDNEWHLVNLVIEPDYSDRSCILHIYVDGVLRNTNNNSSSMDTMWLSPDAVVIGAENETGRGNFHGKVDDVRIYNYALDAMDIALLYTDLNPGVDVCINQDDAWRYFDVVGEPGESSWCKVDIEDFAELAAGWSSCSLFPTCLP
jgi:hypothetical protein